MQSLTREKLLVGTRDMKEKQLDRPHLFISLYLGDGKIILIILRIPSSYRTFKDPYRYP